MSLHPIKQSGQGQSAARFGILIRDLKDAASLYIPDKARTRGSITGTRAVSQTGRRILEKFGPKEQSAEFRTRKGAMKNRIRRVRTAQEISKDDDLVGDILVQT